MSAGTRHMLERSAATDNEGGFARKTSVFVLLGLTCLTFFAAFFCLSWPFSGLPEGLPLSNALLAVLSHTEHQYFFSLLPAGLLPLLLFPVLWRTLEKAGIPEEERPFAERFLAAFAIAGALPHVLSLWGTIAGYLLRRDIPFPIIAKLVENGFFSGMIATLFPIVLNRCRRWNRCFQILSNMFFIAAISMSALLLLQKYF